MKKYFYLIALVLLVSACSTVRQATSVAHPKSYYLDCARRIANSQMQHNPELWMADFVQKPKWDYTQGLIAKAMLETYCRTKDTAYLRYVQSFADFFISPSGQIKTYKLDNYNLDRINGGNFLFLLDSIQPQARYTQAIQLLRSQLLSQPRTSEGGFWHKKIYPWQMWLDGLYMAEPFYAHYARIYGEDSIYTDVVRQFRLVDRHTLKSSNGLNYHGWDESRGQLWADSITGCSSQVWGRAEGWYVMALCDVLDYLPTDYPGRQDLIAILRRVCTALLLYQDPATKMWYQVLDQPNGEQNYTESTCSAMFIYAMAKGARMGYLPASFRQVARTAFDGLWNSAVVCNPDSTYSLTRCCAVAGLGGNPYRSGTYTYYIHEKIRDNDPKGVGPLLLAALELSK